MESGAAVFDCLTISGERLRFLVERDFITIREPDGDSLQIQGDQLTRIEFRNHPWNLQKRGRHFALSFVYRNGTEKGARDAYLSSCDQASIDLLLTLKARFPEQSLIGPNEAERQRVLAASYRAVYRLHSLGISSFLGVSTGILVIAIMMLRLLLATMDPKNIVNAAGLHATERVLVGLALVPFALLVAILGKGLMVVRTSAEGLTWQTIFRRGTVKWGELRVGSAETQVSNVYTGLYCFYCDQPEVFSSKAYLEIPLHEGERRTATVKLSVDEASRLYRELYYRRNVSLESANAVMAFR